MEVMNSEWQDRLAHWISTLKKDLYEPVGEIRWSACRTMDQLSLQEAENLPFEQADPGFTWGKTYEYCWFRSMIRIPEQVQGERIVLSLHPGGESSLFVNGKEFGTYRADWVSEPHQYLEDNTLTRAAEGGETFGLLMETYAGQYYPEGESGACATGPVLPGDYQDPLEEGRRRTLGTCTYGVWNEDGYQLYMDVMTLNHLLHAVDPASLRAAEVAEGLENFTLLVDFEQERAGRTAGYRRARAALAPLLAKNNGSTAPVFYAVGNAHIDLAWLWPMNETVRKTERTFAAQIRHMKEYPDYRFIQSQPAAYEMCRKYYPELFSEILAMIRKGQWIADGAMWVEPDTNMAGGEALIRQVLYGKKYFRDMFGRDSQVLWLPDTFGYSAVLPQILKNCGVKYLVTQKIFWSYNRGEEFPYHYFNWQGMDGTKIISFLPTSYTYETDPETLDGVWKDRRQTEHLKGFLIPYGYGDGGGGPTRDHIEYVLREQDLEGCVRVKSAGPQEFFEEMGKTGDPADTWCGELYFSAHRGTYTSQAMVKKNNRRCEFLLHALELWSVRADLCAEEDDGHSDEHCGRHSCGHGYPAAGIEALWKRLLVLQFHDILPGSGIARVYQDAEKEFHAISEAGMDLIRQAAEEIMSRSAEGKVPAGRTVNDSPDGITVFNALGFERETLVRLPDRYAEGAVATDGTEVPVMSASDGTYAQLRLPAMGTKCVLPAKGPESISPAAEPETAMNPEAGPFCCHAERTEQGYFLENDKVIVRLNERGEIASYRLKEAGSMEFAAGPMNRLRMFRDVPRKFDAWDIDSNYEMQETAGARNVTVEIGENGRLFCSLSVHGTIGNSAYSQIIRLIRGSCRVEIDMTIDWKELHRLLKASFPVNVYADEGINEIQFGYVKRPVHRSRAYDRERFEVCNHRYSALCDGSHGAAVLNDCKYGISMRENELAISLLTAGASPEMRADNRVHEFRYAFMAWTGTFEDSDIVRQGYDFNDEPLIFPGKADLPAFAVPDHANIILDTVKEAEDGSGDLILRLYESKNMACIAAVAFPGLFPKHVFLCDLQENKEEELKAIDDTVRISFRNFEIRTVRIQRHG
jgi:alpha-mannosidase